MADEDLKVIKHDGWTETIHKNGLVQYDGKVPEYMNHEFYKNYKPGAARIQHRATVDQVIALAQRRLAQEE